MITIYTFGSLIILSMHSLYIKLVSISVLLFIIYILGYLKLIIISFTGTKNLEDEMWSKKYLIINQKH